MTWRQDQPADPYQVLGVGTRAERDEIVRAYRQLARACHPDARPGGPQEDSPPGGPQRADAPGPAARRVPVRYIGAGPAAAGGQTGERPGGPASRPPLWAGPVMVEPPAGSHWSPADPWGWWA